MFLNMFMTLEGWTPLFHSLNYFGEVTLMSVLKRLMRPLGSRDTFVVICRWLPFKYIYY